METAPHISDREIVERLTRLEEGQGALREEIKQLREDMNKQFDRVDAQFDRIVNIMLGKTLSKTDEKVANILKKFNLL